MCVYRSVAVRIRHVWLRHEIYKNKNVVILMSSLINVVMLCTYKDVYDCL